MLFEVPLGVRVEVPHPAQGPGTSPQPTVINVEMVQGMENRMARLEGRVMALEVRLEDLVRNVMSLHEKFDTWKNGLSRGSFQ